jgi:hypothetical protein
VIDGVLCMGSVTDFDAAHGSPLCREAGAGAVLGLLVAGPGSDCSEVSMMSGCESATLD